MLVKEAFDSLLHVGEGGFQYLLIVSYTLVKEVFHSLLHVGEGGLVLVSYTW